MFLDLPGSTKASSWETKESMLHCDA